jgi:UDP-N-acetylmuramoyl-L-alanyl-D-glutamate--2,6-diaminopimelate ligase
VLEVADRRAAVAEGVRRAWGGGVLLIAGKGHELGQEISGQVLPFDDREVARQALQATAGLVGVPVGTGTDVEGTNS